MSLEKVNYRGVWEWCADGWQEHLGTQAQIDPWLRQDNPASGVARVVRGGSWNDLGGFVRSARRGWFAPVERFGSLGFRLALGH